MKWRQAEPQTTAAAAGGAAAERAERLEAVLRNMDAAVVEFDARLQWRFLNPAAERLLERLPRLPQLLAPAAAAVREGASWQGRVELPDERTLEAAITPLEGAAAAGAVLVARDVTATVRLETTRRDFIAALSHELRTPLASIRGYGELLALHAEAAPEERQAWLQGMLESSERLTRLAADLTTLSALETGTYPLRLETMEAAGLAEPVLRVMRPQAQAAGATLVNGEWAPGRIRGDAAALDRLLLNLVENALRHGRRHSLALPGAKPPTPPDGRLPSAAAGPGRELRVELSGRAEGDEYLLQVSDNGAGIASADLPRVFERFYRAPGRSVEGTGLGLALVKHIAQEHGGTVTVASELGRGSTFTVRLPREKTA
jgi:two-component system phosphate regulon sensor histidine kinase PhoR